MRTRPGTWVSAKHVIAVVALAALLTGCGQQSGGGDVSGGPGGSGTSGSSGGSGGSGGGERPNPCTFLPDDGLKAALGAPPSADRTVRSGAGLDECTIKTTTQPYAVLQVTVNGNGREGYEIHRDNVKSVVSRYKPLTGIGDDAFAFGTEVTVLKGDYSVTLFLEGPAFGTVPEDERLERAKTLAQVAVAQMS